MGLECSEKLFKKVLTCFWPCSADMNELTEAEIEKVPNMPHIIRAGFYRCLKWYLLSKRCLQLIEYQAQQKRKKSYGALPSCITHAVEADIPLLQAVLYFTAIPEDHDANMNRQASFKFNLSPLLLDVPPLTKDSFIHAGGLLDAAGTWHRWLLVHNVF